MRATAPSDRELDELTLRRAQRGDDEARRNLVERYHRAVHDLVWRMLGGRSRDRVEDLVQETFVRVFTALPGFDPAGPARLSTWILTIAARLTLNERRRPPPEPLDDDPVAPDRADAGAERAHLGRALAAAIGALPDGQRAVLLLRDYHELEYAEIAAALHIDLGTVKSRLARGRAAVRAALARSMPDRFGGEP